MLGAVAVLAACGQAATQGGSSHHRSPQAVTTDDPGLPPPQISYDNPGGGVSVASISVAANVLPVPLLVSDKLGAPVDIYTETYSPYHGVTLVYDDPTYGRVVVQESQPDTTVDEWHAANKELVAETGQPNVHGSAEITTVQNGLEALITTAEGGNPSVLEFRADSGSLIVLVKGPKLSADDCVAIANKL